MPAGVSYAIRHFEPYPFIAKKSSGSRVWDVDGNEYVDYWMGHGALIMGHSYPPVMRAAKEQMDLGSQMGFCNEAELRFAKKVVSMVPSADMMRPTNSGTEAGMYAVRLAKSFTGRRKIAKFEGGWHGGSDILQKGTGYPFDELASAGLDESLQRNTLLVPFNDLDGVRTRVRGQESEIAAYIVEPVIGGQGCIPAEPEFLKGLRKHCDETGALLIFDEVLTGFRLAPGGGQEFYGVMPDLTILGKIVGGGEFPAGCLCGRLHIMERIDHLRNRRKSERSFHGGSFVGNALVARAGYTLLDHLDVHRDEVYPKLASLGARVRRELQDVFDKRNFDAHVTGEGSLFCVHFTRQKPRDVKTANETKNTAMAVAFFNFMLRQNVIFLKPETAHCFISTAHTEEDISNFVSLTEQFVKVHKI